MSSHNSAAAPPRVAPSAVRRRTQIADPFVVPPPPGASIQDELALEQAASDAATARLRTLRLMKETNDREAARLAAENAPPPKAKKPRKKFILG
jgi:hypothetical protein